MDILEYPAASFDGYTSLSTVGLSQYEAAPCFHMQKPVRVELNAMCKEEQCHLFTKLLAACSAGVINRRYDIGPGIVWDDVVPVVSPDSSMKHVLFLSPMVWELDDYEFDRLPCKISVGGSDFG